MNNWNHIETFCLLAENLSFTNTAKALKTSQSAISRQIKNLEEELGTILFIRNKKIVSLSEDGLILKNQILPIFHQLKDIFKNNENKLQSKNITTIKIASLFEIGSTLIHPALMKISEQHPEYRFQLEFGSSKYILEKIINGKVDFGLIHELPSSKLIRTYAIKKDHPVLITSIDNKQNISSISTISLVTYREDDTYSHNFLKKKFKKIQIQKFENHYSVNSHQLMIEYVIKNNAYAVIPLSSAQQSLNEKKIKIITEESKDEPLYFSCNEFILMNKAKKEFLALILKNIK